jgi:hypothetical protein
MKNELIKNTLLRGTIYDETLWQSFVNFSFFDQAIETHALALKADIKKDKIAIPLTPTDDPVLIQILIIERGIILSELGFKVVFLIRDIESNSSKCYPSFNKLLEKRFALIDNNKPEIHIISSFEERLLELLKNKTISFKQPDRDDFNMDAQDIEKEVAVPDINIPVMQKLTYDSLRWLIAAERLGLSFCYVGQVEAYPTEYALNIMQKLDVSIIPCVLYLPELWLFAGTHIYLDDDRKLIFQKIEKSKENRFRSIYEYVIHLKAIARLGSQDDKIFSNLFTLSFQRHYQDSLLKNINELTNIINNILLIWREL